MTTTKEIRAIIRNAELGSDKVTIAKDLGEGVVKIATRRSYFYDITGAQQYSRDALKALQAALGERAKVECTQFKAEFRQWPKTSYYVAYFTITPK